MAAVMMDSSSGVGRRPYFSAIRWTAIIGGIAAGMGSYMLLELLGVATGLTVVNPQSAEPIKGVPLGMGIWTGLITLASAFIGGYVAARMSGLARSSDGMLHGFVTWGATMILFAFMATTAVSAVLGGTFALLGNGVQAAAKASTAAGKQTDVGGELKRIVTGSEGGNFSTENLNAVRQRLQSGDRQGAIDYMVSEMGFTRERANSVVDTAAPLFNGQVPAQARQAAEKTVNSMAAVSWWLFVGFSLSLVVALVGGVLGIRANGNRTLGHHIQQRRPMAES